MYIYSSAMYLCNIVLVGSIDEVLCLSDCIV